MGLVEASVEAMVLVTGNPGSGEFVLSFSAVAEGAEGNPHMGRSWKSGVTHSPDQPRRA